MTQRSIAGISKFKNRHRKRAHHAQNHIVRAGAYKAKAHTGDKTNAHVGRDQTQREFEAYMAGTVNDHRQDPAKPCSW